MLFVSKLTSLVDAVLMSNAADSPSTLLRACTFIIKRFGRMHIQIRIVKRIYHLLTVCFRSLVTERESAGGFYALQDVCTSSRHGMQEEGNIHE